MKKIVLHVGLHRCGSTLLQNLIFPNVANVNFIPRNAIRIWLQDIQYEESATWDLGKSYDTILEKIQLDKINIISAEELSGNFLLRYVNQERVIKRLSLLFPEATIVLVLRRQDYFIESAYRRYIKAGGTRTFLQFINCESNSNRRYALHDYLNINGLNWLYFVDLYKRYFGKNIRIVPFEYFVKNPFSYIEKIFPDFEFKILDFSSQKSFPNEGIGNLQILILRYLNRFLRTPQNPNGLLSISFSNNVFRFVFKSGKKIKFLSKKRPFFDSQLREEIISIHSESNFKLDTIHELGLDEYGYY